MKLMKPTIVFDFDGVIHSYSSGWKGESETPDPPVPEIGETIAELRQSYRVVVQSSRCLTTQGREAVSKYLADHDIIVDGITSEKPPALVYVDDRAIEFDGDVSNLAERIRTFQPWYRRKRTTDERS